MAARSFSFLLIVVVLSGCCSAILRQRSATLCSEYPGPAIPKFCVATPNLLWAGGRPDHNDATWLMQQGIRTVVDLELFHDDRSAFARANPPDSKTYDIRYFHVPDWEPLPMIAPSIEDTRVARVLAITMKEPAPVFLHCRCGMKRASLMVAAHRVVLDGVSADSAIHEMTRYGGAWSGPDSRYIRGLSKRRDEMRRRIAALVPRIKPSAEITFANGRCTVANE